VASQKIFSVFPGDDSYFQLHREASPGVAFSLHGTRFGNPHVGLVADFSYLAIKMADGCAELQNGGDATLTSACHALDNQTTGVSVVTFQAGAILRPSATSYLQSYVEVLAGLANTPTSTVAMVANYTAFGDYNTLRVYRDFQWSTVRPTGTLAIGVSTAPTHGMQFRVELRESFFSVSEVVAADPYQDEQPPYRTIVHGFPSLMAGFDIVFRKDRGKRY
jgi:hypothetical protein